MSSPRSRQRRAIAVSPEKQCMMPPASPTGTSARIASVSSWASRQWTSTGLRRRRARASWARNASSWASRGERRRKKSSPVSPIATTRGAAASRSISASRASSARPAAWGWMPTAAQTSGSRPASATAARELSTSVPIVTMHRTPAPDTGRDGVHRGHVDLRRGQLVEDLPAGADPVVSVDHERTLRALHLPLVLPGDGLEGGGISRDEVELGAPPAREARVGEQVHARLLERTQDPRPLARLVGHQHVEVIDGSHCLSHGDLLQRIGVLWGHAKAQPADELTRARLDVHRPATRRIGRKRRLTRIGPEPLLPPALDGGEAHHVHHLP